MRRRQVLIAVRLLVAGAIVNIGVAWGFAAAAPNQSRIKVAVLHEIYPTLIRTHVDMNQGNPTRIPTSFYIRPPDEVLSNLVGLRIQFERSFQRTRMIASDDVVSGVRCRLTSGFPMHGLSSGWQKRDVFIDFARQSRGKTLALMIVPRWPGFAINTIFYAAILGALFAALSVRRRKGRSRRGLCPACAYPIGPSPICTECGAMVSLRAGTPRLTSDP